MFEHRHQEGLQNYDTALILTNFGWHFERDEGTPAGRTCGRGPKIPHFLSVPIRSICSAEPFQSTGNHG